MKSVLLLLLASIAVPAWAADAAPSTTTQTQATQAASAQAPAAKPIQIAKADTTQAALPIKQDPAKSNWKPSGAASGKAPSTGYTTCSIQTCNGISACYNPRCGGACNTCTQ